MTHVRTCRSDAWRGLVIAGWFYWRPQSLCRLVLLHTTVHACLLPLTGTKLIFRWIQLDMCIWVRAAVLQGDMQTSSLHGCRDRAHTGCPLPFFFFFFLLLSSLQFLKGLFSTSLSSPVEVCGDWRQGRWRLGLQLCFFQGIITNVYSLPWWKMGWVIARVACC